MNLVHLGPSMATSEQLWRAPSWSIAGRSIGMMIFGAFLAFMLSVSEYLLVSNTSGLGLAIAGIFKVIFVFKYSCLMPKFGLFSNLLTIVEELFQGLLAY